MPADQGGDGGVAAGEEELGGGDEAIGGDGHDGRIESCGIAHESVRGGAHAAACLQRWTGAGCKVSAGGTGPEVARRPHPGGPHR